jgi:phosphatidylglycerophosphate synthase
MESLKQWLATVGSMPQNWTRPQIPSMTQALEGRSRPRISALGNWKTFLFLGVLILTMFRKLISLNLNVMTPEDLQLTYVGAILLVLLISACVAIGKLTENQQ